jgi:RNA polymerase sigma factor (TIGR02999 family)
VTVLLDAWRDGDSHALESLMPLVYEDLHRMAHFYLSREYPGHLLQDTALVNEVYLCFVRLESVDWQGREHFFAASAQLMRHILTDYARMRLSRKRGGDLRQVGMDCLDKLSLYRDAELVALDDALATLEALDKRKSLIVELHFYAGLELQDIATLLKVSLGTVKRDWRLAKVWLLRELGGAGTLCATEAKGDCSPL